MKQKRKLHKGICEVCKKSCTTHVIAAGRIHFAHKKCEKLANQALHRFFKAYKITENDNAKRTPHRQVVYLWVWNKW